MRIAFFADAFPSLSVTFIINQITGLLARGHQVDVYAQRVDRAHAFHPDVRAFDLVSRTVEIGAPPGSRGRRLGLVLGRLLRSPARAAALLASLPPRRRDQEARSLRYFFATARFPGPRSYDAIHCHFGPNGNLAVHLRSVGLLRGPIVTTFHGYDMRRGEAEGPDCFALLREHGERFLSISGYNLRLLRSWGFPESRLVEHRVGIQLGRFPYRGVRRDAEFLRLLTVANLVPVKGHVWALRALAELRHRRPELRWEYRLVGAGPEREAIERQRDELGLREQVVLLGGLGQEAVRGELQQSDLFLLPSLGEATPVALMEAQAVGLPVLATRVGAVDEVVAEGAGALAKPGDAEDLLAGLLHILDRRPEWDAMARAGRAHVEKHFDVERLTDRLLEIYAEAAADLRDPSARSAPNRVAAELE